MGDVLLRLLLVLWIPAADAVQPRQALGPGVLCDPRALLGTVRAPSRQKLSTSLLKAGRTMRLELAVCIRREGEEC